MRHIKTDVPLVEGGKKFLGEKKVKEVAEKVVKQGKKHLVDVAEKVVKQAKKHSHRLVDVAEIAGDHVGASAGEALGAMAGIPVIGKAVGRAVGSKVGRVVGEKAHAKIQSLKKGGKVVTDITDTRPKEHKEKVVAKRVNMALKDVQAIRKAKGVSLKDAWAMYKSGKGA